MQKYDFDNLVNRKNTGNMKAWICPEIVNEKKLISYNAAEMDFKTAPSIIRAIKECADNGLFGFTLKDDLYTNAVVNWMKTQRNTQIKGEWIVPTYGTIFSVATCIRMCCKEPDDGIIIQAPVYNRYKQAADRLGFRTEINNLVLTEDNSYEMDLEDLEEKMSKAENKLLILCNPQNPTGTVWTEETLESIARLAIKYDVIVYSDEIFAEYTFHGAYVPMYCTINNGENNGISATSLGKAFNFTGVNHANMIIANDNLRERFTIQRTADHYGSMDPTSRAAVIGAYSEEGAAWINEVRKLVEENYRKIKTFFDENNPEIKITPLQGGYEIWIDFRTLGLDEKQLMKFLEEKAYFVPEAGSDFCGDYEGYVRMNLATPMWMLDKTLEYLKNIF